MQEWSGGKTLSSGSAEGRHEQQNHPGAEVQLLSASWSKLAPPYSKPIVLLLVPAGLLPAYGSVSPCGRIEYSMLFGAAVKPTRL
jgi:hypothetical protein